MSRAFVSFFNFRFDQFYHYNKLSVVVIPIVLIIATRQFVDLVIWLRKYQSA
jgi:hypothetical protein